MSLDKRPVEYEDRAEFCKVVCIGKQNGKPSCSFLKTAQAGDELLLAMRRILSLPVCLLLIFPLLAQKDGQTLEEDEKSPVARARQTVDGVNRLAPRQVVPHPRVSQPYPRPARWEYCIFEIRVRASEQGSSLFQLHMPGRSSGRTRDIGKVFREVHMQLAKTSKIDEVNALNSLGGLGWELVSTQKKDGLAGISVFYYFKRRI